MSNWWISLPLLALGCSRVAPSFGETDEDEASDEAESTSGTTTDAETESSTDAETESSTDTGSSEEAETSPPTFVPEFDVQQVTECDVFAQDCPEGEKCVPYGSTGGNWDAFKCVPVLGDGTWGEPCHYDGVVEATDDCDATGHCWDVMDFDGEAIGICAPFCLGSESDPMCPPGYSCLISASSSLGICIRTCDPLVQDCGEGLACFWANNDFNCLFTTRDIPVGEPCGFINDCAAGLACLAADLFPDCAGAACCGAFCDLNLGDQPCLDALPGTACVAFFEQGMAPPGYDKVGVCIVPP